MDIARYHNDMKGERIKLDDNDIPSDRYFRIGKYAYKAVFCKATGYLLKDEQGGYWYEYEYKGELYYGRCDKRRLETLPPDRSFNSYSTGERITAHSTGYEVFDAVKNEWWNEYEHEGELFYGR